MRAIHELKTWPEPFAAVGRRDKRYEVRVFDRPYRVGDLLFLREWVPTEERYTGCWLLKIVTYITPPGTFGLPDDVGVLGIADWDATEAPRA